MKFNIPSKWLLWAIASGSVINLIAGFWRPDLVLAASGIIGLGYIVVRRVAANRRRSAPEAVAAPSVPNQTARPEPADPNDPDALAEQMLAQGRYTLLLRPQIAANLGKEQFDRVLDALEEGMALVPDGDVVLGQVDRAPDDNQLEEGEIGNGQGRLIRVGRFFLDRYLVTNRQYFEFVAAGGYEQMTLWDESIWTAILHFVDQTGDPGPRYWSDGQFDPAKADHPVVGVCWHEAMAYARWAGKRLPTDAEWVKAGSWPVRLSSTSRLQRRYPWGQTMERSRANLWGSGPKATVAVGQFSEGVSVGGVYQLIGNVWEWTRGEFRGFDFPEEQWPDDAPMKSIRGGAFDTYFDNQATCQFQSGETAVSRKHNIGFRCAVGVCDLSLAHDAEPAAPPAEEDLVAEEVSP